MNLRPFERRKAFFLSQIVFAVASSLFCVWRMITYPALKAVFENKPLPNEWTWSAIILFDLVFLILCVGLCTEPCIQLLTEFTEEGILQLSFPSSKFIRWQDIQRVSVKANHIQISGQTTKLDLHILSFKHPKEFTIELKGRIPKSVISANVHWEIAQHRQRALHPKIMKFLFFRLAKQIAIDIHPSRFTFTSYGL